jgi:hypothetical protein
MVKALKEVLGQDSTIRLVPFYPRRVKRPIITTGDDPHADPEKDRRLLHVIIGDVSTSEASTYLKMGITAPVPVMI